MSVAARPSRESALRAALEDRKHATRVSSGLIAPGIILIALGRPELMIYAVFGSFAGMYGRAEDRALRLLHQIQGASVLLAGTAAGLALSEAHAGPQWVTATATVFAIGVSLLADFFALRPEGPFYGIFALGAIAGVPPTLTSSWEAIGIAAASAALAILIGFAGPHQNVDREAIVAAFRARRSRTRHAAFIHALRYAVAVAAAGTVGIAVGLHHVNWAIAGAAVTLAAGDPRGRLQRGIHRVVGTIAGLAVTVILLTPTYGPRTLAVIVILLVFPTELFMAVNYALALSFFTPMIMLMTELAQPIGVRELVTSRVAGTIVGVLIGIAVSFLMRDPSRATEESAPLIAPAGVSDDDPN